MKIEVAETVLVAPKLIALHQCVRMTSSLSKVEKLKNSHDMIGISMKLDI